MRINRVYHQGAYATGDTLILNPNAAGHLIRVLRLKLGDSLQIFDGEGNEFAAKIIVRTKQTVEIAVGKRLNNQTESPIYIHLIQGISRGDRMDFAIQKATELGVNHVTPVITERCGINLNAERWQKRQQHWQAVAISAAEQSGRSSVPQILAPQSLTQCLNEGVLGECLLLSPGAEQTLTKSIAGAQRFTLLIGPEGGLSQAEQNQAVAHNFRAIALGPRVLRTETAAMAAITALQCLFGDL